MKESAREHHGFVFAADGRTFTCSVEPTHRPSGEAWWWFRVSAESHQRYAPFRAEASDTDDDVRMRILAYYEHLLARRAEPARGHWSRGRGAQPAPAANTAPA